MTEVITPEESKIDRIDSYVFDERFYRKTLEDGTEIFQPSVTYVLQCVYPQGPELAEWRGDLGNKRADEVLEEAGTLGSFVHESIDGILNGNDVTQETIEARFKPKSALKIMRCLKAFLEWFHKYKPVILKTEHTVWMDAPSPELHARLGHDPDVDPKDCEKCLELSGFAGTVDLLCEIDGEIYLVDYKTSKSLRNSHRAQVTGYGMTVPAHHVALLHLGNQTKAKWSFKVLTDDERKQSQNEFVEALRTFKTHFPDAKPSMEKFPNVFTLKPQEDKELM